MVKPCGMLVGPSVAADAAGGYQIKVFRVDRDECPWQADHGNSHAIGKTAGEAVDRLIRFIEREK